MGSKKTVQMGWRLSSFISISIIAIFICYAIAVVDNNNIFGQSFDAIISRPNSDKNIPRKLTPNEFGDSFGALNTFFSSFAFLFIALSFNLQRKELEEQRKYTRETAEETKANAIVDLYQIYTSESFHQAGMNAWKVLLNCVKCKEYSDFVVNTNFVTEYNKRRIDTKLFNILRDKDMYDGDLNPVIFHENEDRHRLLDVMNFFNILSLRYNPEEESMKKVFDRCDFFYDWWRPLLWWHSDEIDKKYDELDPSLHKFIIKPKWNGMLERLDILYAFPKSTSEQRLKDFIIHPLIESIGLDIRHLASSTNRV